MTFRPPCTSADTGRGMRLTGLYRVRVWLPRVGVAAASMTMLVACGGAPEGRTDGTRQARVLTYEQFVGVELGTERSAAERALGAPKETWRDPSRGSCAGWDRADQRPVANQPAFIACFQEGRLASKSILDPDAFD